MSDKKGELSEFQYRIREFGVIVGLAAVGITLAFLSKYNIFNNDQPLLPEVEAGTPISSPAATSTESLSGITVPVLGSSQCIIIQPGEITWDAAQKLGATWTIFDYESYRVTALNDINNPNDDQLVGTIIPNTWDVTTSTDEQIRLRCDNSGNQLCAINYIDP